MKYLSPEEILVIHSEIIDQTGGSHGVRDVGLLVSATNRPKTAFGGKELYQDMFQKAAVYLDSLVHYHVFVDGNKRTAFAATARFLFLNKYILELKNKEIENYVLKVAVKKPELDQIAEWLKKHSKKMKS